MTLKWDVWCLGCVYLELLSWFAFGNDIGIKRFAEERMRVRHDWKVLDHLQLPPTSEAVFFRLVAIETPWSRLMQWIIRKSTFTIDAEVSPAVTSVSLIAAPQRRAAYDLN
ncbi:hypothetical protein IMZ48_11160 [Candidatus Bathyarchaeota archaeon]|nr:hypothetical protein [Candidatus Bathyarchaeota archaeon]